MFKRTGECRDREKEDYLDLGSPSPAPRFISLEKQPGDFPFWDPDPPHLASGWNYYLESDQPQVL